MTAARLARHQGARSVGLLMGLAAIGGAGSDRHLFVLVDVRQAINHPPAYLEEFGTFAGPAPTLKGPWTDPPPLRQFDLVDANRVASGCLHLRVLSFGQV